MKGKLALVVTLLISMLVNIALIVILVRGPARTWKPHRLSYVESGLDRAILVRFADRAEFLPTDRPVELEFIDRKFLADYDSPELLIYSGCNTDSWSDARLLLRYERADGVPRHSINPGSEVWIGNEIPEALPGRESAEVDYYDLHSGVEAIRSFRFPRSTEGVLVTGRTHDWEEWHYEGEGSVRGVLDLRPELLERLIDELQRQREWSQTGRQPEFPWQEHPDPDALRAKLGFPPESTIDQWRYGDHVITIAIDPTTDRAYYSDVWH